jgi:hypothetical protein
MTSILNTSCSCQPENLRCEPCQPGHYSVGDSVGCMPCEVAKYSNAVNANTCNSCMQNATSLQGSLVEEYCVCKIGHKMDSTRSTSACSQCPPGKYKSINISSTYLLCEEGSYSHLIGSCGCKSCPPNTYSTTGAISISECGCLVGTRDLQSMPP